MPGFNSTVRLQTLGGEVEENILINNWAARSPPGKLRAMDFGFLLMVCFNLSKILWVRFTG
jgi:hypothetical protein